VPTFLTNRKMPPALAARVEASVRGRRPDGGRPSATRFVSVLRLGAFALIVIAVCWLYLQRRRVRLELEQERASLLEQLRRESRGLSQTDLALVTRVQALLARSAGKYDGDSVSADVRGEAALTRTLARPMVYVRGPLASVASSNGIGESASSSFKDALVLCLLAPPASRNEKALLAKARAANAGDDRMAPAAHVERLHDAIIGFPVLQPAWEARVAAADTRAALKPLQTIFRRAPLKAAKRAAKAQLLLFAIDEPGDGKGPTELDGERPHHVRVGLIELGTEKLLLRVRRHVDPGWISEKARAEYASGIDSCALALDVRSEAIGVPVAGGG
jgi:hypothetical protein